MEDTLLIGDPPFVTANSCRTRALDGVTCCRIADVRRDDIAVFMSPSSRAWFLVSESSAFPATVFTCATMSCTATARSWLSHSSDTTREPSPYTENFPAVPPSEGGVTNEKWAEELPKHIEGDDIVCTSG